MASKMEDINLGAGSAAAPDLEWQSFPANTAAHTPPVAQNAAVAGARSPTVPPPGEANAPDVLANPLACLSPSFYFQLFDVDTADIVLRLKASALPLQQQSFLQIIRNKIDFYGPFWVCATLVFLIGVGSNLARWASFAPEGTISIWKYDFKLLTLALFTVYGYVAGAAAGSWVVLNYLSVSGFSLITALCLYGYSMTPFLAAAAICIIPSSVLAWISISVAAALSALFLFKNMWILTAEQLPPPQSRVVSLLVVGVQIAFGLVLKFYFFSG